VAPDGTLVPDVAARLPGRGFWLKPERDVLAAALKRGAFVRAAKAAGIDQPVRVPPDLAARTEAALRARLADLIGLARRAGQAVAGHDKVAEWAAGGRAALLVQAADGSAAGRAKLQRRATGATAIAPLAAAELGRIFGRDHAVHVAIAAGRLADSIATDCLRLAGLAPLGANTSDDAQLRDTRTDTE
jgi:hypothetical protein